MTFPLVTAAQWRAQVEQELGGISFEKALVQRTPEGLSIPSLYTQAESTHLIDVGERFGICMRHKPDADVSQLTEDLDNGADGLWVSSHSLSQIEERDAFFVIEGPLPDRVRADLRFALAGQEGDEVGGMAKEISKRYPHGVGAMVSTLPYHQAGADSADELAFSLSTGAAHLAAMLQEGLGARAAARQLGVQISVGRDTFGELCKLRALRVCWSKLLRAAGAGGAGRLLVHAVCSSRTVSQRDPWVNILRCTTQVFAAALGGADWITPMAFDGALGAPSVLAQRLARNTGLILREESALGRVMDPAGGSYFLETLTDQLAREAWRRFRELEKEGGIAQVRASGKLEARLDAAWRARRALVAKRQVPVLGISEFANLEEDLPIRPPALAVIAGHRDAEPFEHLRTQLEGAGRRPEALLVMLGSGSEARARANFASGIFAAGGIRCREVTADQKAPVACLCGTDERYASEAVARVRSLKAAGCQRVLFAGRPGSLEPALKEAGIDGFIYMGCDVVQVLTELLEVWV